MKPIDPAEISALLDGELPRQRADQVRRAIAEDEALGREYEKICALDGDLKVYAQSVAFRPRVSVSAAPASRIPLIPLAFACLLLRFVLKSVPPVLGTGLEIAVLVFLVGWALQRLLAASEQDCREAARDIAAIL